MTAMQGSKLIAASTYIHIHTSIVRLGVIYEPCKRDYEIYMLEIVAGHWPIN